MPSLTQVGTRGLIRRRLLDELDALRAAPLALVVAPAGFGKTTLLSHYAHAFDGRVCSLTATAADADPSVFGGRLCDALRASPSGGALGTSGNPAALLAEAARAGDGDTLLIIDDAHHLEGTETEAWLGRLLLAAPASLHTALATRRMPGLNLARHELSGLVVIDADRLRFRSWEVEELLRDVYREPLPPADTAALARRLGGWGAGLHMYHLSTRGRGLAERRAAVAAMDGGTAHNRAYLARTVLAELPDTLRDFLVRTSVFDVVTARRCNGLLGRRDSQHRLEDLERLQAFTTSHDGGRTYAYHEVMRSYLTATLANEWEERAARDWYARAGGLLWAEGALAEAARAYARAEDWPIVRQLLDQLGASIVDDPVGSWSEVLPEWLVAEDPWLVLAEGRHLFSRGQMTAAIEHFARAESLVSSEYGRSHCRAAMTSAQIWLPGPSLPGPTLTGLIPSRGNGGPPSRRANDWTGLLRVATKRRPASLAEHAVARTDSDGQCVQVLAHLLAGNVVEAERRLADADLQAPGVAGVALRLLHAAAQLARGQPGAANRLADIAVEAERRRWPWFVRMARAAIAVDLTEQSAKTALAVAEECRRDGDPWGQVLAAGLAWVGQAGAAGARADELAELAGVARQLDAEVLEAWLSGLLAVAAAVALLPDADAEADRAGSMAQAAGVPAARVAALAAHARLAGTFSALADQARAAATECGLPDPVVAAWLAPASTVTAGTATGARISVLCIGGFATYVDGQRLDWSAVRPRARALIRLLALNEGRMLHRDVLTDALWPDLPPASATHNLHVAMSSLRKVLQPAAGRGQLLVRDGDAYGLRLPADGYCDVAALRAALDRARHAQRRGDRATALRCLRAAVAAYTGDLLPEDGAAEWVVREREDLRHGVAAAAAALAAAELSAGNDASAVLAAQRSVEIDRYHDEGWRRLIEAHERGGDQASAARARARYRDTLSELGLGPAVFARG